MTNSQKKTILDFNFTKNYQDYYKIVEKIRNNRKKHQALDIEDILTIIYINLNKRLDKIDDYYFTDANQFRALVINTINSQISWGNSDITQHINKLNPNYNSIFEDAEEEIDVTGTPARINGERIHQDTDDNIDDYDDKLNFIQTQYPQLLSTNLDKAMWRLIVQQKNISNVKLSNITQIPLTTSSKMLANFKNKIKYIYQNNKYIQFKPSLLLIADLHPTFQKKLLKSINMLENNHPDVYVVITEGYTSIREQFIINKEQNKTGLTSLNYGLGARIAVFDQNGPLELTDYIISNFIYNGLELTDNNLIQIDGFDIKWVKSQFTNKNFIKNTQFIKYEINSTTNR